MPAGENFFSFGVCRVKNVLFFRQRVISLSPPPSSGSKELIAPHPRGHFVLPFSTAGSLPPPKVLWQSKSFFSGFALGLPVSRCRLRP